MNAKYSCAAFDFGEYVMTLSPCAGASAMLTLAPVDCAKEELENLAFDLPEIKALTDGKTVVKKIAVPNKLVNIVVK